MITSLYLGLLGFIYFFMTIKVIKGRWKYKVSLGVGENNELLPVVSAHNNFSNYVPFFLIAFYLLEVQSLHFLFLHLIGIAFFIGRIMHYMALDGKMNFKLRKLSMHLTLWPLLIVFGFNVFLYGYNALQIVLVHL